MAKTATKTGNKRSTKSMKKAMSTRQGKLIEAAGESANMPEGEEDVTIDRRRAVRRGRDDCLDVNPDRNAGHDRDPNPNDARGRSRSATG